MVRIKKNLCIAIIFFLFVFSLSGTVFAEWSAPTKNPPDGNLPGPVWLNSTQPQLGTLNLTSPNTPVISVDGKGSQGFVSTGVDFGIIGGGGIAGVRGIGTAPASYGLFGQSQDGGYSAGFDGPLIFLPQDKDLVSGNHGTLYYQSNPINNKVYFCSRVNGCESITDWEDLVYGAWDKKNKDIYLAKPGYTIHGPVDENLYINSDKNVQLRFNAGGKDGQSAFIINNGLNESVFSVNAVGMVTPYGGITIPSGESITLGGKRITSWDDLVITTNSGEQTKPSSPSSPSSSSGTSTQSGNNNSGSKNPQIGQTQQTTAQQSNQNSGQTQTTPDVSGIATSTGLSLNGAYNFGGAGLGRSIIANSGAVTIDSSANNSLEVRNGSGSGYAGFFSASGGSGRAVYGVATETSSGSINYGGYFRSQGDSGIGVYGEALGFGGTAISGRGHNGAYGGQFISETSTGSDVGVLANASIAGVFQGGSLGLDAFCSNNSCRGAHIQAQGGGNSIGLLVNSTSGYAAQFIGQESIFGSDVSSLNTNFISGNGDVYIERNLEVDGKLCLGNVCTDTLGGGYWGYDSVKQFLYPNSSAKIVLGAPVDGTIVTARYPMTVNDSFLVGLSSGTNDTGLLFNANVSNRSQVQSYVGGSAAGLAINPSGGYVSVGNDQAGRDVATDAGDLFITGDIEVEGRICFRGSGNCQNTWSSGGGGGTDSDWVINTIATTMHDIGAETGANYKVGIGTSSPTQKLDVAGAIRVGTSATGTEGAIRWSGTDFEGYTDSGTWVSLTATGSGLWEDGVSGVYENDEAVIVGNDGAETIANSNFASGGLGIGDLFVADELGVEGSIYTDGSFIAGAGLTLNDSGITDSNGDIALTSTSNSVTVSLGGASGDVFAVDGSTFVVDSQNNNVGVRTVPSSDYALHVVGNSNTGILVSSSGAVPALSAVATGAGGNALDVNSSFNYGAVITASGSAEALLVIGNGFRSATLATGFVNIGGFTWQENYVDGRGDLIVEDELEVDGNSYLGDGNDRVCINRLSCATHPVLVGSDGTNGNGAHLTAGGTWTDTSSRDKKDRFYDLDKEKILKNILGMSVTGWYYKGTEETHIGPVSEDFYDLFGTGLDNKHIAAYDLAGIALVGVQALAERVETLEKRIANQDSVIAELIDRIKDLEDKN